MEQSVERLMQKKGWNRAGFLLLIYQAIRAYQI